MIYIPRDGKNTYSITTNEAEFFHEVENEVEYRLVKEH